ncbi:MAG: transcriptional repressor [Desulfuromonadales bacterium]|nr:transcriptional repressor [Desulfuromonadales bacterium]
MVDSQGRLKDILDRLRQRDLRITPQRIAILKAFLQSQDHPSVEQVHEEVKANFPTTSLATVYKTVNLLKEVGEILEIGFADGGNRYDGNNPSPHPHLICTRCNKIIDPEVSLLDQLTAEVAETTGYRIDSHQIEFFGVCPSCRGE